MRTIIETPRLQLLACDMAVIEAVLVSDEALAELLDIQITQNWSTFGKEIFEYSKAKLLDQPEEANWGAYLPILKEENRLIGSGGFKGRPNEHGMVEIGYEIAVAYRQRGLATEMAEALIEHSRKNPAVRKVWAHTLAEENISCKVLEKCGLLRIGEFEDADDGWIWRWELEF